LLDSFGFQQHWPFVKSVQLSNCFMCVFVCVHVCVCVCVCVCVLYICGMLYDMI